MWGYVWGQILQTSCHPIGESKECPLRKRNLLFRPFSKSIVRCVLQSIATRTSLRGNCHALEPSSFS
eukprot:4949715-Amphidinium_carterae.1